MPNPYPYPVTLPPKSYPSTLNLNLNLQDDVPAHDLICPPPHSGLNIPQTALDEYKSKEKIIELFIKIGYNLPLNVMELIFLEASQVHNLRCMSDIS
jgi:hypothetical protein